MISVDEWYTLVWRAFPYTKRPFVINLISLLLVLLALAYLLIILSPDLIIPLLILALGFAITVLMGISPLITDHEIENDDLMLRQGWYFHARIPLMEVKKVSKIPRGPTRTGVYFSLRSSTLYVTTRRDDLIEVLLHGKRQFKWALGKRADRIIFDAEDTDTLIKAIEEGSSLSPVQTEGSPA